MYVWDHLQLSFPVTAALGRRHPSPGRDRRPPHRHHRRRRGSSRPTVRVEGKDGRRRRRGGADPAAGRRRRRCRRGRPARTSTSSCRRARPAVLAVRRPGRPRTYRLGVLRDAERRRRFAVRPRRAAGGRHRPVRGPRNNFALAASPRYLFLAGGIGITPILPMIAAAEAAGAEWRLVYGGRHRASMAFLDELAALRRPGHGRARRTRPGCSTSTRCSARREPDTLVYCCGPEPLLAAVEQRCAAWPSRSAARRAVRRPAGRPRRSAPRRSRSNWRAAG